MLLGAWNSECGSGSPKSYWMLILRANWKQYLFWQLNVFEAEIVFKAESLKKPLRFFSNASHINQPKRSLFSCWQVYRVQIAAFGPGASLRPAEGHCAQQGGAGATRPLRCRLARHRSQVVDTVLFFIVLVNLRSRLAGHRSQVVDTACIQIHWIFAAGWLGSGTW